MTCGDRSRRRIGLGIAFNRDDYAFRTEKCFKITYYLHTPQPYLDIYVSDFVCAYECSAGGWYTSTSKNGNPHEPPLRRHFYTQCYDCRAFNEEADVWISVDT